MIYQRYIIATDSIHGNGLASVCKLWSHDDGTSLFRVHCDDAGFVWLKSEHDAGRITVFPSLDAPASSLTGRAKDYFKGHGNNIIAGQNDTLLNLLRKMRNDKGPDFAHILIDKAH